MMEHLRSIDLQVELSPGTDIRNACVDITELARRMGITITAKFNNVTLMANMFDNPLDILSNYHKEIDSKHSYKIATGKR